MEVLQLQAQLTEVTTAISSVSNELKTLRNFLTSKFGLELEKFLEESQVSLRVDLGDIPNETSDDAFPSGDLQQESQGSEPSSSSPKGKCHRRSLRKRKLLVSSTSEVEVLEGSSVSNDNNEDSVDVEEAQVSALSTLAEEDSEECLKVESVCSLSSQGEAEKTKEVGVGSRGRRDPEELKDLVELHVERTHKNGDKSERRSSAGQRRSYTMQFKKAVLKYRETHTGEETARVHGITASTLRGWRRQQMEIAAATEGNAGDVKKRLKGGGRKRAAGAGGQTPSEEKKRSKGEEEEGSSGESSDEAGDDEEPEVQGELVELENLLSSA